MEEITKDPCEAILEFDSNHSDEKMKVNQKNLSTTSEFEVDELSVPFSKIQIITKKKSQFFKGLNVQKLLKSIQIQGSEVQVSNNQQKQEKEKSNIIQRKEAFIKINLIILKNVKNQLMKDFGSKNLCDSNKTPTAIIRALNENKDEDEKIKDSDLIRRKISAIISIPLNSPLVAEFEININNFLISLLPKIFSLI